MKVEMEKQRVIDSMQVEMAKSKKLKLKLKRSSG
jgi:hypothetical protein